MGGASAAQAGCTQAQEVPVWQAVLHLSGAGCGQRLARAGITGGSESTFPQVMAFLGSTGYYCKFILGFATTAAPLTDLMRKTVKTEDEPLKCDIGIAQKMNRKRLGHTHAIYC